MKTYLITGATSGLGRQVALRLARQGARLILPVRNAQAGEALGQAMQAAGSQQVATPAMDLASLGSVSEFAWTLGGHADVRLDGVLLNAGVQSANEIEYTADGFETTFAVNHLAHHLLLQGLLGRLNAGAIVGWTASGTHDPADRAARLTGFRGAQYVSAEKLSRGECEPGCSVTQACKDLYATSKLCNIVSARAFAERCQDVATFFSFDPGLMPGTGLARRHGVAARWVWHRVLPRLAALLPGTSSPQGSAEALVARLTAEGTELRNGGYYDYTGSLREPAAPATERWVQEDLMQVSDSLLRAFTLGLRPSSTDTPPPIMSARI